MVMLAKAPAVSCSALKRIQGKMNWVAFAVISNDFSMPRISRDLFCSPLRTQDYLVIRSASVFFCKIVRMFLTPGRVMELEAGY